jgi:hypothetical protein
MKVLIRVVTVLAVQCLMICPSAHAITHGFTESFSANDANWRGLANAQSVMFHATGGVDDSGYISHLESADPPAGNFSGAIPPTQAAGGAIIFRANANVDASGDAFTGNWIDAGITRVQAFVRHDFTEKPINYYLRLAPAAGGAEIFLGDTEVVNGQWSLVNFAISPDNWFSGGAANFGQALVNIANFQIGALIETPFTNTTTPVFFEIDEISVVPEPASAAFTIGAVLAGLSVRRRRSR